MTNLKKCFLKKEPFGHFGNTLIFSEKQFKQFQGHPLISQKGKLRSKDELRSIKYIEWAEHGGCFYVTFIVYSSMYPTNVCESRALYQA